MKIAPKVSIGFPVYNGANTIDKAINSLLTQTFKDFELIISDNASNDETGNICRRFASIDSRIHYVRQDDNIGPFANFKFVLSKATGEYFMWAAADDWRSPEFLEANVLALDSNPKYVASTSPHCFEGEENKPNKYINFGLEGSLVERYVCFLRHVWESHGIFYSLIRTENIKNCKEVARSYIAKDWSINFFLLSKGEIYRTIEGLAVFGKNGLSGTGNINSWRYFRNKPVEVIIPLYQFSRYALSLMRKLRIREWLLVFVWLLKVNLSAIISNFRISIKEFIKYMIKQS